MYCSSQRQRFYQWSWHDRLRFVVVFCSLPLRPRTLGPHGGKYSPAPAPNPPQIWKVLMIGNSLHVLQQYAEDVRATRTGGSTPAARAVRDDRARRRHAQATLGGRQSDQSDRTRRLGFCDPSRAEHARRESPGGRTATHRQSEPVFHFRTPIPQKPSARAARARSFSHSGPGRTYQRKTTTLWTSCIINWARTSAPSSRPSASPGAQSGNKKSILHSIATITRTLRALRGSLSGHRLCSLRRLLRRRPGRPAASYHGKAHRHERSGELRQGTTTRRSVPGIRALYSGRGKRELDHQPAVRTRAGSTQTRAAPSSATGTRPSADDRGTGRRLDRRIESVSQSHRSPGGDDAAANA